MPVFCNNCGRENRDTSKFCSGCSTALQQTSSPSGPLSSGTILEKRYKIIELIKSGGMGAVYKALDDKLDRICAVKELLPPFGTPQQQAQAAEWFKREAKLLAKLSHANLPGVIDSFTFNGRYYLVMEFIEGMDLDTILQKDGNPGLPEDKVVEWAKQVLMVLEYLHNQNPPIIYRDIKPGNIMIHKDGRAMLIDFGIARTVQEASQTKKTAVGTEGYAPPEQCRGQVEPRSDICALGATMHQLLTGIQPIPFMFEPVGKNVKVSPEVETIVMKALSLKVEDRFKTAGEMRSSFSKKQGGSVVSPAVITKVLPKAPASKPTGSYIKLEMVLIPSGTFERKYVVKPRNTSFGSPILFVWSGNITIENSVMVSSFYIGKYPVTNKEYKLFKPEHKGHWSEPDYPVETVNWYDAVKYCNWLSDKEGLDKCYSGSGDDIVCDFSKNGYRLPTEAEWEYACRAGTTTEYYWGNSMNGSYCCYKDNSGSQVNTVGQKKPNQFGLYDMSGNVWEKCWDWFDKNKNYYENGPSKNPVGPSSGSIRVDRGGSLEQLRECLPVGMPRRQTARHRRLRPRFPPC